MIKVDVSDLIDYQKLIDKKIKDVDKFLRECANELGMRLLTKDIRRTPVRSGALRNGWKQSETVKYADEYLASVYNNVEYAQYVNYGHRIMNKKGEEVGWQEGKFMLEES